MNNIININKHNLLQTNVPTTASNVSISVDGVEAAVAANSTDFSGSFRATFQKVSDQSTFNENVQTNGVAGNNLPVALPLTDGFPELSAENDQALTATGFDDTNLLITENSHRMLNAKGAAATDEDQSLTAETVLNKSSVTDEHVDEEPNYAISSLMPSPSLINPPINSPSIKSVTQPAEAAIASESVQSKNVSDSKLIGNKITGEQGNDLAHADLTHIAVTRPVSESISKLSTQSLTQPVALTPPSTTSLQPALGKASVEADSRVMNVDTSEMTGAMAEEIATKHILNKINESGEKLLQGQLLTSGKTVPVSAGASTNNISQNLIDSNISKQVVEKDITVLQDDLITVDDILLKSKQSLYSQKLMGSVEPSPLKSNSVAATLSNVQLNNQEAVELNKLDAIRSSTTIASNQTEEITSTVATINGFSSQLRTALQTRPNTTTSQIDGVSVTLSGNSTRLEKNLMQSMDGLSLTAESSGLLPDKIQNLPNALTQQQLFATTQSPQTAHLVQTITKAIDTHSDNLLGITNPALNNITNVNSIVNSLSPPQVEITEAFGRSAWPQAMGKQVLSMINQNIGSAEIRLNPAHLGPIEILIDMAEDQINVSLTSRHAVVREAMEQALPRLREMLDENGFSLADADISKHSFAEQREQNTKNNDHATDINATTIDQLTTSEITDLGIRHATESTGIVDYFV